MIGDEENGKSRNCKAIEGLWIDIGVG